jgi:CubicO group peptidase (beta-lactamase class C family)
MYHTLEGVDASAAVFNTAPMHRAMIPGSTAICTAHGLATIGALLAEGGSLGGVTLLRPQTLDWALSAGHARAEADVVLGAPFTWTVGGFFGPADFGGGVLWYGWEGWGGSRVLFSRERRLSYAYVTMGMRHDASLETRHVEVLDALRRAGALRASLEP